MPSFAYKVTNVSKSYQSLNGYSLAPNFSTTVTNLTAEVVSGVKDGKFITSPPISELNIFTLVNTGTSLINLGDLTIVAQGVAYVTELTPEIMNYFDSAQLAISPSPFTVPVFNGINATEGPSTEDSNFTVLFNDDSITLGIGTPVYANASGSIQRAVGNNSATVNVIGLVADTTIATSSSGNIITGGNLTATTAQWDAITGGSGGLIPDQQYFLSPTNLGKLTPVPPTPILNETVWSVEIGIAVSITELKVEVQNSVLL